MDHAYVHGYVPREETRLQDQASTLAELLHSDTRYPANCRVLEAGCGVGAQTLTLAQNSPKARFTSIDISGTSLVKAQSRVAAAGVTNVEFEQADVFDLAFGTDTFDHVFVCFVLEHLSHPLEALLSLKNVLKSGGTVTVIEGDHGSAYFHPQSAVAHQAIASLVELQRRAGGNALIGRSLYPLLTEAEFQLARVSPRMVYADASRPELVDGFTRKTFTAMIEGVREATTEACLMEPAAFDQGIQDLYRTGAPDGVFCYTFFKGTGRKP